MSITFLSFVAAISIQSTTVAVSDEELLEQVRAFDAASTYAQDTALLTIGRRISADAEALSEALSPGLAADIMLTVGRGLIDGGDVDGGIVALEQAITLQRRALAEAQAGAIEDGGVFLVRERLYEALRSVAIVFRGVGREALEIRAQEYTAEADILLSEHLSAGSTLQTLGSGGPDTEPDGSESFQVINVFYGTHRAATGSRDPNLAYGIERGELRYGEVQVSVPNARAPGSIPRPLFAIGESNSLHIVLRRVNEFEGENGFDGALSASLGVGDEMGQDDVFVFIHGHAVSFAQAARQTAQLAVDLDMRNGATFFAWPTGDSVAAYQASQNNVRSAALRLERFLSEVLEESNGSDVHVIAHSMGNRVLLQALERMSASSDEAPIFDQIIWASPDVDAELFAELIGEVRPLASGMTAYTSSRDRALNTSMRLAGGELRAGQSAPLPAIAEVITAVDTSELSTGPLGHSDFSTGAIEDIQSVVWLSLPPEGRCILEPVELENGARFWRAVDDRPSCEQRTFRRALASVRLFGRSAVEQINLFLAGELSDDDRQSWRDAREIVDELNID